MHIVSASYDHTAWLWNIATGECKEKLKGHSGWVNSAVFSSDGMHIVSASNDHTARIWNTATGECEAELKGHSGSVTSAVFSPDGMYIVSASYSNQTAWIWNTITGECEAELKGHSGSVTSAVFSVDGMHIVSTSGDYTARIWNTATGECEAELKGHSDRVNSAVFSSDGMHIVSASDDHTARIWNTATGECEAQLSEQSPAPYLFDNSQLPIASPISGVCIHHNSTGQFYPSHQLSFLDLYENTVSHIINFQTLKIPPPFHRPSCVSYHLSKICLGYGSGEILLLQVCKIITLCSTLLLLTLLILFF